MVLRLTRSRLWIGLLGSLLVGIVAFNVFALSFNASSSKTAALADELRRENSALGAQIADGLSNERVLQAAARLGLIVPEPGAILYLDPKPGDAAAAANRLENGAIALGASSAPPPIVAESPVVTDPAVVPEATDPATTETPTPAEVPVVEQAPTDSGAAPTGGITP
jgi:hypothetical protein